MRHAFSLTPSLSLFVTCQSDAEIEQVTASLGADGQVLMPLGEYGFSRRFARANDRFGVSWQVSLP